MKATILVTMLVAILLPAMASADMPGLMNYQGTLTDTIGVALDTTVSMTFSIYTDSTGGIQVWTETQPAVEINNSLFNVLLGSVNAISDTVFKDPERWLGVQVESDPELQPRQLIGAVPYAFWSAGADTADYVRHGGGGDDGDWTVSGSDMYSNVSGNVGIGTTNPLAKLHVEESSTEDLLRVRQAGSTKLILTNEGNVGIGTASPTCALDVNGNVTVDMYIGRRADEDTYIRFISDQIDLYAGGLQMVTADEEDIQDIVVINRGGGDVDFQVKSGILADALFVRGEDGNVGIGTAHPISNLHVAGYGNSLYGTYVSNSATGNGGAALYAQMASPAWGWNGYAVRGHITVSDSGGIHHGVRGDAYSASPLLSGKAYGVYGRGGNAAPGYNFGVYGELCGSNQGAAVCGVDNTDPGGIEPTIVGTYAGYFHGDVRITSDIYAGGTITSGSSITIDGIDDEITASGGTLSFDDENIVTTGDVGIGTTSPAEKLHVAGDIRLDAGGDIAFADDNTRIHENADDLYFEADDDIYISPDDDIGLDGITLYVDGSADKVGIGTASPETKLHVEGEVKSVVAGTEFYMIPQGGIIMWSGSLASIPTGWQLCDGTNGTPDLRDRFVLGVSTGEDPGVTGGTSSHSHTVDAHTHSVDPPPGNTSFDGSHTHTMGPPNNTKAFSDDLVPPVDYDGASDDHTHTIYSAGNHNHSFDVVAFDSGASSPGTSVEAHLPPYYKLAFIMKL